MSSYTRPITIRRLGRWAQVLEPFRYHFGSADSDVWIEVPDGRWSDGSSIPWWCEWAVTRADAFMAGLVHDELAFLHARGDINVSYWEMATYWREALEVTVRSIYVKEPVARAWKVFWSYPAMVALGVFHPLGEKLGHKWGGEPPPLDDE